MFKEYSSIENSYREKEVEQVRLHGLDKVEWVATEKCHGSNFSFWPIDGQVIPGKRSSLTDGSFYGCQAVVEEMAPKILALGLTVYGELFGHGIQKGVNYGKKRFAAFDIWTGEGFVDYDEFVSLCDTHSIERCVEIARGSFDDLLAIDPAFPTRMSDCGATDIAEGFVMKPIKAAMFGNGSRVILKKKSPNFSEQSKGSKPKIDMTLTENQQTLLDLASTYVTMAKLENVMSKLNEPNFSEVLGEFTKDIFEEVSRDGVVDHSTWKSISKPLGGLVAPLIRSVLFGVPL